MDNQGELAVRVLCESPSATPNICKSNRRVHTISLCALLYALGATNFKSTLANFCKKCIIFNIHYCLGCKMSKFDNDMILISESSI